MVMLAVNLVIFCLQPGLSCCPVLAAGMCSQERVWTHPVRGQPQQADVEILAEKERDLTESSGGEGDLLNAR